MGLVDPAVFGWTKLDEYSFYSLRPGIWGGELLEDANFVVCDWIYALHRCGSDQLSDLAKVCPFYILFCFDWPPFSFRRSYDLRSKKVD